MVMDTNQENLDIYDGTGKPIGVKPREEVHRDGDWHRTFHCWIIFADKEGDGYVILQKRAENKSSWPGMVDVTAAGHYRAGETQKDGLREVEEEIGIKVSMKSLIPLGMRVCIEEFTKGKVNHEFQDVFFLLGDPDLENYRLQVDELSGLVKARIEDLLNLFSGKVDEITADGFQLKYTENGFIRDPIIYVLTRQHFIPSLDQYNYKIMILAKRALQNEEHLLI